jgi:hypothetical protein
MKINQLEKLASELVGDGKRPNLFFVSVAGEVRLIARDFDLAYDAWRGLPYSCGLSPHAEVLLEDRLHGVICQTQLEVERPDTGAKVRITIDDSKNFGLR